MKNYTPLRYPGGKIKTYNYVKELIKINNCKTYIEPYAGGSGVAMALLLNGNINKVMLNDYDRAIYALWYSILNSTTELIKLIESTSITVEEWEKQKKIYNQKEDIEDLLKLGYATLFLNRTNRSGILKAGIIGGKKQNGKYKIDCRFNKKDLCNKIKRISKFKNKIKLYNLDAEVFIKTSITKTKDSFTFLDPPYYKKGPGLYTNFYSHENHKSLSKTIDTFMKNKYWILTYDYCDEIYEMYSHLDSQTHYINYSISTPTKGLEYIFYSPILNRGDTSKYLKLH
ncbi:DNA adenine methylase [Staphylococcus sp. EG-SA-6]|uniref:DNA adenine methylase n=1 Tax=Staphylococcus TaxID=1279 RepID=UPI0006B9199C|nr:MULTISPECIES: DNA adenine methylase [Staphylococcus]MBN4935680.1 DNA adenine methylase [Staphylococcus sp. EG-SA-6]KPG90188.1 DNA methyltransferase [Staphylococcus hominis]MDA2790475.1 DNA adenine methylase [Staphylococcus aureus]QGR76329.1 DNA adenine methylase [Staphylococcus hominis]HCZ9919712.1 DNA adenine methylase [Staphylococcus aureus]